MKILIIINIIVFIANIFMNVHIGNLGVAFGWGCASLWAISLLNLYNKPMQCHWGCDADFIIIN